MKLFRELLDILNRDKELLCDNIEKLEKEIRWNDVILNINRLAEKGEKIYLSQVKEIANYYPDLSKYNMLLQEIESMYTSIKNGFYNEVFTDKIRIVLLNNGIFIDEVNKVINDFLICNKLNNYIKMDNSDSRIIDIFKEAQDNVLKHIQLVYDSSFNRLIKEIQEKNIYLDDNELLKKRKQELDKKLESINYLSELFDENGFINSISTDDLELFYKWLERINYDKKIEVIKYIIFKQAKGRDKGIDEIIEDNRELVFDKINNALESTNNIFDTIDLSNLNEEEKEILLKIKRIYINKSIFNNNRIKLSDKELGNREVSYHDKDKIDWEIVLGDIENNLMPSILINHEYVMEILKYICKIYNEELNNKIDDDVERREMSR